MEYFRSYGFNNWFALVRPAEINLRTLTEPKIHVVDMNAFHTS